VAPKAKKAGRKKGKKGTPKPTVDLGRTFGPNLRRCRKAAGLSQEELADRADVHRTQISLMERGLRNAGFDTLARLAGALEINPGQLFVGGDWVPGEGADSGRFHYSDDRPAAEDPDRQSRPKSA
jgi:transcriptional regulator with XRE-family HTH domain